MDKTQTKSYNLSNHGNDPSQRLRNFDPTHYFEMIVIEYKVDVAINRIET